MAKFSCLTAIELICILKLDLIGLVESAQIEEFCPRCHKHVNAWGRVKLRINFTCVFNFFPNYPRRSSTRAIFEKLKALLKLIPKLTRSHAISPEIMDLSATRDNGAICAQRIKKTFIAMEYGITCTQS